MTFKVLVATPWFKTRPAPALDRLRAAGCEVVTNQQERAYNETELIQAIPGIHATIAGSEPYNDRTLSAAGDLKVVARLGVGFDQIDVTAATRHGVAIAMAFGTNHEAVADHAFALIAGLGNQLLPYRRKIMDGGWGSHFHRSLWKSTVGIIGLGRIGRALARRCAAFEMRTLAFDVQPDADYAKAAGIELVDLDTLIGQSDFISVNTPHNPDSDKLINAERLAQMKPTAYVVNTARGGVIDEAALVEALQSGRIAGAGLDVFEVEPLPKQAALRSLDNVLLTPHCAGSSDRAVDLMLARCIDSILAIKDGGNPGEQYLLNPEVFG
ncbi:MAG: phosphoglycerate dehydrogenase [Geminicoccaceae bacterium]